MDFSGYLGASSVRLDVHLKTRKRVLETLAEMLSDGRSDIQVQEVFTGLLNREKLGSTALGSGIAVPHCRLDNLLQPVAAILGAAAGVDYDAPDRKPVKLFFSLLVPGQSHSEYLHLLAGLASRFQDAQCVKALMQSHNQLQIEHALDNTQS